MPKLTNRQIELVRWLADGKTHQEAADIMGITKSSLHKSLYICFGATGTRNTNGLVAYCLRKGIIQ